MTKLSFLPAFKKHATPLLAATTHTANRYI
jgi:hypothetical protein